MNYAIYFGLAFVGCFMALMLFVIIMSWLSDILLSEDEYED